MKKTTTARVTRVQREAMTAAAAEWLGKLSGSLAGVTLDSLVSKRLAYEGDNRGRRIGPARLAGYTGFSSYYLTREAYRVLGMPIFRTCAHCVHGTFVPADEPQCWRCTTPECRRRITRSELQLTDQQYPEVRDGRLAIVTKAAEMTGTPGADAGVCDQCGVLVVWDRSGRRIHDEYGEYWCSTTRRQAGRNPNGTSAVHVRAAG
ncbi:hypothetical protein ACIG5E_34190 [Kitasatospora sp. NPDC053057]|uniref:hypothetical protein n=1 Tax=Kitasatospora sp. NPDC053057 TaxID=3364062 RepID=UPI0037CA40AA